MSDEIPESAQPFGSEAHLRWRKAERSAGRLNPPLKFISHAWSCTCSNCRPQSVLDAIKEFDHDCDRCSGRREILIAVINGKYIFSPCPLCEGKQPLEIFK